MIEKVKILLDDDEWYPYYLARPGKRRHPWEVEIELTRAAWEEYRKIARDHERWQKHLGYLYGEALKRDQQG